MIHFDHFTLTCSSKILLKNYSAAFPQGQLVGLLGANGSGKTSFLKALAGLSSQYHGYICVNQKKLSTFSSKELATFRTYIPATPLCYWDFTTQDVLEMENPSFHLHHSLLDALKIRLLLPQKFSTLSSGEKARVFLAYALIKDHPFLLLDEITSHLDDEYQRTTLRLLQEQARKGKTIFLALHQKNLALDYCNQVLWLENQQLLSLKKAHPILQEVRF